MYLETAPVIDDPTDYDQCGSTREFFGFDAGFINDQQICDDVEQLRFSRDFSFLETFTGQGTDVTLEEPNLESPEDIDPPVDGEPPPVPDFELDAIVRGMCQYSLQLSLVRSVVVADFVSLQMGMAVAILPQFKMGVRGELPTSR